MDPIIKPTELKDRRKIIRLVSVTFGAMIASILVGLLCTPRVHFTAETCARIEQGMSLDEVEVVIGGSQGWHDGIGGFHAIDPTWWNLVNPPWWCGLSGTIELIVDSDGRVLQSRFSAIEVTNWSFAEFAFERITGRRWIDLPQWSEI